MMTDNIYSRYVDEILRKPTFAARLLNNAPQVKITWKDRLRWKLNEYKSRLFLVWEVIRGKHECGEY